MKHLSLTLLSCLCLATVAEAGPVYPTPQQCSIQKQTTRVTKVTVHRRTNKDTQGVWAELPGDREGGYAIRVTNGSADVYANDELGVYYAKQTLSQLLVGVPHATDGQRDPFPNKSLQDVAKMGDLPLCSVTDWPDLRFRGSVEGYYGIPWGAAARKSQFEFYGRNKMNFYLYAPKDDPLHHGGGCYKPYPDDKAKELKEQIEHAKKNHVRFVWGIHPANTVNWNKDNGKEQLEGLCTKLQHMYELGVRDFAVLVDDSGGEINKPERQVQLCNYILENFIRKHPDVNQELVMCPSGYNRGWTNPAFLNTLGKGLDKDIHVMWTGDSVVHDITLSGQQWVAEHLGRPTFIWWNWPCNDFKAARLSMGRTYGLGQEKEMPAMMSGFVANPMERAEASKVGLFGVADYTWNIRGFKSESSWKDGISRLYPTQAQAMQVFCDHNSYLLPNGHGYYREESASVEKTARAYIESVAKRQPDLKAAKELRAEYKRMSKAARSLRKAKDIDALKKEIDPWLEAFALTGRAGEAAIDALEAKETARSLEHFMSAVEASHGIERLERTAWRNNSVQKVDGVEVSMLAMTPAMEDTLRYLNARIYAALAGKKLSSLVPVFTTNAGDAKEKPELMSDGDRNTFWESKQAQKTGDWYALDFGAVTEIRTIVLQMGGPRAQDFVRRGQLEYQAKDGTWKPIGKPTDTASVILDLGRKKIHAKQLRYRVLENDNHWLSLCEFTVNKPLPAWCDTDMPGMKRTMPYRDHKSVGLNRINEVSSAAPGSFLQLNLPTPTVPTWLEIDMENPSIDRWAKVELTLADGSVVPVNAHREGTKLIARQDALPKKPVSSMKLVQNGKEPQEVKLLMFKLDVPPYDPRADVASLTDRDFRTPYELTGRSLKHTLEVPKKAKQLHVIGNTDITVEGAEATPRQGVMQTFNLKEGVKRVTLKAPAKEGRCIYEVIFR